MSNSPGLRGGAIGSAVPKSFSSSPNSGAPFQRTCQTACVDSFLPSSSIDFSLSRNVANPLGAIFGSVIAHPTAVMTRGRSPSLSETCWPAVFVVANLCSRKKPAATMRYVAGDFRHHNSRRGHQCQTNKWLTLCTEQLHLLAVFAYRAFAAQAAMCLRATQA